MWDESEYWRHKASRETDLYERYLNNNNYFAEMCRPSTIYKPKIMQDGDAWIALLGENLAEGVTGTGKSPSEAFYDFDENFYGKKNNG